MFASVAGNMRSDEAKIGGMVPDVFTLSGRCAVCPPYTRRPTWRREYTIGICRRPFSKNAIVAIASTRSPTITAIVSGWISPLFVAMYVATDSGMRVTMLAKMRREMPFEMPRSVICSPTHIRKAVPVVSVIIVIRMNPMPGCETRPAASSDPDWLCSRFAMPYAWKSDSATVP